MSNTRETSVMLNSIEKVKTFVGIATKRDFEIDVQSQTGRHCVDAKSIMGVFSLNLSKPVTIIVPEVEPGPDVVVASDEDIAAFFEEIKIVEKLN